MKLILTLCLTISASKCLSDEALLFGLENSILSSFFLSQAISIASSGDELTRDLYQKDGETLIDPTGFQVLQLAYRADPDATLDLVQRILEASKLR